RFYQEMYDRIKESKQLTIVRESVISLQSNGLMAEVKTTKNTYQTNWLFNSLIPFAPIPQQVRSGIKQHFLGQWIETEEDVFDPRKMRLMDFSVQKQAPVQFVYVLPVSPRKALIEYTVFSKSIWDKARYKKEIKNYLGETYGISQFELREEESGVIPMCPETFPRFTEGRIVHIGSAGGLTKASTGYTFHRIIEDSKAIVKSMAEHGRPIPKLYASGRFAFYDRLLLWLIQNKPETIPGIMFKLFGCKVDTVFRFLGEKTHLLEEIGLFLRLPWPPFLTALWYEYFKPSSKKSLGSTTQPDNFDLPLSQLANGNQPRV
ncbi:MAG: lycopene cyclase family protein, partial [Bacteroidota bacterium]